MFQASHVSQLAATMYSFGTTYLRNQAEKVSISCTVFISKAFYVPLVLCYACYHAWCSLCLFFILSVSRSVCFTFDWPLFQIALSL